MAEDMEKDTVVGSTDNKPAKKEKKAKNDKKAKKTSSYFKDLKSEFKKITWFSAHDTLQHSVWVIIALVVLGVIIGGVNWAFGSLIALIG